MDLFMRYTPFQIHGGWQITNSRLSGSQIRNVTVIGLEITTNDQEVESYFKRFGVKFLSKEAKYCRYTSGKWKGKKNSDRTYLMHLGDTNAPLGTYHLIDNVRVQISYRNCVQTYGRCYSTPDFCVGGGFARKCAELGGPRIKLEEHIEWLAQEHIKRKQVYIERQEHDNTEPSDVILVNHTPQATLTHT